MHPTKTLPILVLIDMFSVSLVVPLLIQYFTDSGVSNASQREMLSSIFSISQIVGGLVLGALADSRVMSRRTILFISFAGSAVAYILIVLRSFPALVISRIVVGLVKQTMTITTTMMANCTSSEDRAKYIGRLGASATVAFVVGPSVGAFLYKNVDPRAPAILASGMFVVDIILATFLLPNQENHQNENPEEGEKKPEKKSSFMSNIVACFSSHELAVVISSLLLFSWFYRATSPDSLANFYEKLYGMEVHQRGYLRSYQQLLSFCIQSFVVGPVLAWFGGERRAVTYSVILLTIGSFIQIGGPLPIYLLVVSPMMSVGSAIASLSLQSLVTTTAPKDSLGSVLAALDVLQSVVGVTVPFYRSVLFVLMADENSQNTDADGNPDPQEWLVVSSLHWVVGCVLIGYMLGVSRGTKKLV